jgi:hypothetical protein
MKEVYYIGLDLHKKIIAYCIKTASGVTVSRGTVAATRSALLKWVESLPQDGGGRHAKLHLHSFCSFACTTPSNLELLKQGNLSKSLIIKIFQS